jgi:hypothetical protein
VTKEVEQMTSAPPQSERVLVVRYSDGHGPAEGTIAAHQAVVNRLGYVWFGKFGRRVGAETLEALRRHAASGADVAVILVASSADGYRFDSCRLLDSGFSVPHDEATAVPDYYGRFLQPPSTWLKVADFHRLSLEQASRVRVFESQVPLPVGLRRSWSGHFLALGSSSALLFPV